MKGCGRYFSAVLVAGAGLWMGTVSAQGGNRFELVEGKSGVTVNVDGKLFARYVIGEGNKPFLYPVLAPTRLPMTRSYPMENAEGEQRDHPHHRSVWFGHQSVAGLDSWGDPLTVEEKVAKKQDPAAKEKARQEGLAKMAATVHREFVKLSSEQDRGVIVSRNDYVDASGRKLMADERTCTFRVPDEKTRTIDVDIVLSAPYGPVVLGDIKDAGFCVRVCTPLAPDSKQGALLVNSRGDRDKDTWGKRADWCGYSGVVNGQKLGVAMLNHPSSWRYPTPWHARTYGLLTANPFGLKSIAREEKSGEVELKPADSLTLRHRLVFHVGDTTEAGIQKAWEAYAAEK